MKHNRNHHRSGGALLPVVIATIVFGAWALAWEWRNAHPNASNHGGGGTAHHHHAHNAGKAGVASTQ